MAHEQVWKPGDMVLTAYGYGQVYMFLKSHGLYRVRFLEDGANVYRDLLYKDLNPVRPLDPSDTEGR